MNEYNWVCLMKKG